MTWIAKIAGILVAVIAAQCEWLDVVHDGSEGSLALHLAYLTKAERSHKAALALFNASATSKTVSHQHPPNAKGDGG